MAEDPNRSAGVIRSTKEYLSEMSPDKNPAQELTQLSSSGDDDSPNIRRDSPRAIRNRAEKQRRDNLNNSISKLGTMLPAVLAANKKVDKTGILRLTAHYLRSHHYVFGDIFAENMRNFSDKAAQTLLRAMNGFILTTTYKGIVVVVSQQVEKHLGYNEVELLGRNVLNIVHVDDRAMMLHELLPTCVKFGPHGELLLPDEPDAVHAVTEMLAKEHRSFFVRFIKQSGRSGPRQYQLCHVRGSFRKSDRACSTTGRCCQMMCRMRNRGETFTPSGNDVVFIGFVQPMSETFMRERHLESSRMEYRTRHSIDGEILQSEHRISMVTGYLTNEVVGVNAMNFMHKDDVRWVIIALREMYDKHRLIGESCYRLMTKTGDFVFMRTRGQLEVEQLSGAVSTFVCVNTVVEEDEGAALIRKMKHKYSLMVGRRDCVQETSVQELNICMPAVEHPDRLKKVIIHLVSELPYGMIDEEVGNGRFGGASVRRPLAIIPREPEVIVNAIERSYEVIPHRAPIKNASYLQQDHNEPTPGLGGTETNSGSNNSQNSQEYESTSDSQTNVFDSESNSTELPSSDISIPIEISFTNSFDCQNETSNSELHFESDSNSINEGSDDDNPSDTAQPATEPIEINPIPSHDGTATDTNLHITQVYEPQVTASVVVYKLNYGLTEIVGPSDIIEPISETIGMTNDSTIIQNEKSTGINSEKEPQLFSTASESAYNSTDAGTLYAIDHPTPGPSAIISDQTAYMTAIDAASGISEATPGPSGVNSDKTAYMTTIGAPSAIDEPTPGPSGINNYDLSSEAHVSLTKRDQLLAEAQNIGNLPLSMEGASASMKRGNSSDEDEGNTKKFCDETQLTCNNGEIDYFSAEYDSELLVEGLFMSPRMQVILDNAINTIQERVLNDEPYVDDSWWDEAQQSMPSLQDDKK